MGAVVSGPHIGGLRHRVSIEVPIRTATEGGAATQTWTPLSDAFAEIMPLKGQERLTGDRLVPRNVFKITFRHRADVTESARIRWGTRSFAIRAVRDIDERGRWTVCDCEEILK